MATQKSINKVRSRLIKESKVVGDIESTLNIYVNSLPKVTNDFIRVTGTSGIKEKKYYVSFSPYEINK